MKRYTIGLITGILLTASAFMFMGAQTKVQEVGRFQVTSTAWQGYVFYSIFDTKLGYITKEWKRETKFIGFFKK